MIRGEGTAVVHGVTPEDVFDFVLDPAQYTKADTKIVWVTKLADVADGMVAREDGTFLGLFHGSVITRYQWTRPTSIDVVLVHGVPRALHAWFEIEAVEGGRGFATSRSSTSGTVLSASCTTPWPARGSRARWSAKSPRSRACSSRASGAGGPSPPRRRKCSSSGPGDRGPVIGPPVIRRRR